MNNSKISRKPTGIIQSYGVNTNQGAVRNYNEDRVSIFLNLKKGKSVCSFFAIYDGHGGAICANRLRDELHHHVLEHPELLSDPPKALAEGMRKMDEIFLS